MDDGGIGGLSGSLLEIADNPARIDELYEIMGEFCHKHRNRLNNLKLGIYLARQAGEGGADLWNEAQSAYLAIEAAIDRLQRLCRPLRLNRGHYELGTLLEDYRVRWSDRGLPVDWRPPRLPAAGWFDPSALGEALDDWATGRAAIPGRSEEVWVAWGQSRGRFRIDWEERGDSAIVDPEDLSLAVLARVVSAHGGSCRVSTGGGIRLSIAWPSGDRPGPGVKDGAAIGGVAVRP